MAVVVRGGLLSTLLATLLPIVVPVTSSEATGTSSAWRVTSRAAKRCLDRGEFESAVKGYQSALQSLRNEAPSAEEQYDLMLNLVEAYYREHRYVNAYMILNQLEQVIKTRPFADPLFRVRFLRKRGFLGIDAGYRKGAVEDLFESLTILEHYFEKRSKTIVDGHHHVLEKLIASKDWPDALVLVRKWKEEISSGTVPERLQGLFGSCREHTRDLICSYVKRGELGQATYLLATYSDIEPDLKAKLEDWLLFRRSCPLDFIDPFVANSSDLLSHWLSQPELRSGDRRVSMETLMDCHRALVHLYEQQGNTEKTLNEWRSIKQLEEGSHTVMQTEWLSLMELELSCPIVCVKKNRVSDWVVEALKVVSTKVTGLIEQGTINDMFLLARARSIECRARFFYVSACIKSNLLEEGERELNALPLSSVMPNQFRDYEVRLARLHLLFAKACIKAEHLSKARVHKKVADALLKANPVPQSLKAELNQLSVGVSKNLGSDSPATER